MKLTVLEKQKKKILVVEDNAVERGILKEILSEDYQVVEAENGKQALDILHNEEDISAILLDILMPVMDGNTFLLEKKKEKRFSLIPVIVLTQATDEADEIATLQNGAADFIPKPYNPVVIKHRIASIIKLRETAAKVNEYQFDKLTGLYTKEFFYAKVRRRLEKHPEKDYVILSVNIENFKLYNDTFGRKAGDELLKKEASLLKKRVSEDSICCHYSADRMLCLTDKESESKGREKFIKARKYTRSELEENVTVKLGIYEISDRSIPVEKMCDRALWVVDSIKGMYDKYFAVYDDTLRSQVLREQAITDTMELSLEQNQFSVYYQPKYNLHDGSLIGAEALVRWVHPDLGFLSPGEFIPLFEKNGFVSKLDEYVWETTCKNLRNWQKEGYDIVPISVNVSRADIYNAQLSQYFNNLTERYHLDPTYLHLEITESAYTENPEQIIDAVEELRRQGFVIEMDDFGSGYSSLNMLGQMTVDILKLDMGFIRSEMAKPVEQSIMSDVINMAHRMHLNVVAEGVETAEQRDRLKLLGCDYVQGYFYSKPLPAADYEKLLESTTVQAKQSSTKDNDIMQAGDKKIVLVIEDNEINREMLSDILADKYYVLTAENGREGLETLRKHSRRISAVLLDIQMPVMNGYEFLDQVGKNIAFGSIPIIVTTALNSQEEEEKCIRLGAADFIEKPYNARRILTRIENLVHLKQYDSLRNELLVEPLTGFKTRKAYFEDIARMEKEAEQDDHSMGIIFADINGLKQMNDREGHQAGDRLIVEISSFIRQVFPEADCYRLGGDEFVVFARERNQKTFSAKLEELKRRFQKGKSAAIGSIWVEHVSTLEEQVALADQAMYRDKSRYYEDISHGPRRKQEFTTEDLFRKVNEVSEYLPGGFFIYKADETEEIISTNMELIHLFGCETKEEFREFTGNTFRGMVHPDDLQLVENKIDEQIEKDNDIDYVEYRIICKDGSQKLLRDYGRFVHTEIYGNVYYVFVNDITTEKRK